MNTDTAPANDLDLDAGSVPPEDLSISALTRELNLHKRPNWLLRVLMNTLEKKRQAKGLGWSRPWNKTDLNVFRTHTHDRKTDSAYFDPVPDFLDSFLTGIPHFYQQYVLDLLADPECMTFSFYHNRDTGSEQFEGITLSFGRKIPEDKTRRDRFDIILEDKRSEDRVDGQVDSVRLYICPWQNYKDDRQHFHSETRQLDSEQQKAVQTLFEHTVRYYHEWKNDEERQWSHWSQRYIEYFGPRKFIPVGTSFS